MLQMIDYFKLIAKVIVPSVCCSDCTLLKSLAGS